MRLFWSVVFLAAGLSSPCDARAQEGGPPEWVGLYSLELIGWLENENRLDEICGRGALQPTEVYRCREAALEPKVLAIPLRTGPSDEARIVGRLIVVAVPGRGLSAHYTPSGTPEATGRETAVVPLNPDLYLRDWGYGPYFHHSFLQRDGNWFLLPERPFEQAVWIDIEEAFGHVSLIGVSEGDILTSPDGDWFVEGVREDGIRVRDEQPADQWCEPTDAPPVQPAPVHLRPNRELRDNHGHLLIRPKYLKGC